MMEDQTDNGETRCGLIWRRALLCLPFLLVLAVAACSPLSRLPAQRAQVTTVTVAAPTTTPAPTPNVDATVGAAVHATVQAMGIGSIPTPPPTATPPVSQLTDANWGLAINDVYRYGGVPAVLTGRVTQTFDYSPSESGFLMYTDPEAQQGLAVIGPSPVTVKKDDYVRVEGKVQGNYQGTLPTGQGFSGARVAATTVKVITREAAVAPAIKTDRVSKPLTQNGVVVTLDRVELAKQETRVYLNVTNGAAQPIILNPGSIRLVQSEQQYEPKTLQNSGYPQLPAMLVPGAKADAVFVFSAISPAQPLRVFWDGVGFSQTNQNTPRFTPFQWTVGG